jgi:hypothetical protein
MTVTPGNLAMGPGELYVGTFGAAEPLPQEVNNAPATSAWTDAGGTLGGLTFTVVNTWKELDVDQLIEAPTRRRTKREVHMKTQLAEVTFANFVNLMTGGDVVSSTLWETYEPDDVNSGDEPTFKAVLFDGSGAGGLRRRVVVRKCLNTDNVDMANHPDNQQVFPAMFNSHYVSSSIRSWKITNAKPAP